MDTGWSASGISIHQLFSGTRNERIRVPQQSSEHAGPAHSDGTTELLSTDSIPQPKLRAAVGNRSPHLESRPDGSYILASFFHSIRHFRLIPSKDPDDIDNGIRIGSVRLPGKRTSSSEVNLTAHITQCSRDQHRRLDPIPFGQPFYPGIFQRNR